MAEGRSKRKGKKVGKTDTATDAKQKDSLHVADLGAA
jgi:hypothetical protein